MEVNRRHPDEQREPKTVADLLAFLRDLDPALPLQFSVMNEKEAFGVSGRRATVWPSYPSPDASAPTGVQIEVWITTQAIAALGPLGAMGNTDRTKTH
jgi:hypothetical protein